MTPRPLVALSFALIVVASLAGVAHGGSPWPVDPSVEERPPDLPPWLIASRFGRPLDEPPREDVTAAGGLSDLDAVLLRDAPQPIEETPQRLLPAA